MFRTGVLLDLSIASYKYIYYISPCPQATMRHLRYLEAAASTANAAWNFQLVLSGLSPPT